MSDGSENIYLVDGQSLQVTDSFRVYDPETDSFVKALNELEFVNGFLFANVWYQDVLLKIAPDTGYIVKKWDISSLTRAEQAF